MLLTFSPTITRRVQVEVLYVHRFSCMHQLQFQALITQDLQLIGRIGKEKANEIRQIIEKKLNYKNNKNYSSGSGLS